jgi:splicing factor U2AF subunit
MANYGEVDEIIVCDNLGEHILGNVYVKFTKEDYAINALKNLHGRYYSGKLILPEFSPVIDFRESRYL